MLSNRTRPVNSPLKLGEIRFINAFPLSSEARPLFKHLPSADIETKTCIHVASPAQLNAAMLNGQLDVSPVSSVFYARHSDRFKVLNGTCIASTSSVRSVLFVAPRRWRQAATGAKSAKRIWLPDTSETSIFLLRWMLSQDGFSGDALHALSYTPGQALALLAQGEALLTIGDEALQLEAHLKNSGLIEDVDCIDIARYWRAQTGLPCVFAVWIAQRDWAEANPEALLAIETTLQQQQNAFYCDPESQANVLRDIAKRHPALIESIGSEGLKDYLCRALSYDFNAAAQASLARLHSLCNAFETSSSTLTRPETTPSVTEPYVSRHRPEPIQQPVHR